MRRGSRIFLVLALLGLPGSARAHPVPFSFLDIRLAGRSLEGTLVLHSYDVAHELKVAPVERLLESDFARLRSAELARLISDRVMVAGDGLPLVLHWSLPEVLPERESIRIRFREQLEASPERIAISTRLFPYDPRHQTFLNIYEKDTLIQAILSPGEPEFEYYPGTAEGRFALVRRFVPAGVEHILIGPDHLLFLMGLLLLGGSVRRLVLIVTTFTVAHTVTLTLAALSIFAPPARIIEPLIALSIVYVGADNLLRRGGRDTRTWIAFAFGLIHGFGFAYVLREMNLPAQALGWSLFAFNVGVEAGQLLVVLTVASGLSALRSRSEPAGQKVAVVGSWGVMAAGVFWYIERVFFPGGMS